MENNYRKERPEIVGYLCVVNLWEMCLFNFYEEITY